nr:Rid family hydrolase [Halomonas socia]
MLISGQIGGDAEGHLAGSNLAEQTEAALDNVERLLLSLGSDLSRVVMLRIYLAEFARYEQQSVVEVLRRRFPVAPPAASWLIVRGLSEPEWLIAIEAEAVLPEPIAGESVCAPI